jgi:2-polyprenyl-3-methyl-5-hydroxy-6-metoxy-1,4-benzoquinol methylase
MTATDANPLYESIKDPDAYRCAYNALMEEPTNRLRVRAVGETLAHVDGPIDRVLDVASGGGAYVNAVREAVGGSRNVRFVPIDRQHACVGGYRLNHRGATPALADVTALPFKPGSFDLAMCLDIIEHLDDDVAFMRGIREVLRPGGWALVCTHNSRSLQHVLGLTTSAIQGKKWLGWDPTHVRFYNRSTLGRVMSDAGFDVVAWNGTYFLPFHVPARIVSKPLEMLGLRRPARAAHRIIETPFYLLNQLAEAISERALVSQLGWGIIALARRREQA